MSLTLQQRLDRINVRVEELEFWRERETVPVDGWQFDGAPIALGGFWPRNDGVRKLAAEAVVPDHWPLDETLLMLNVGGESLIALTPAGGGETERSLRPAGSHGPSGSRRAPGAGRCGRGRGGAAGGVARPRGPCRPVAPAPPPDPARQ